ncbi:cobalamin biosynthesis protein [Sphingomonas melonis]|uniref:cobalamin biosynthesis protein n=1 Tax=Sphingomonas melonis TaxID=152682 RepID=UPI0015C9A15D
MIVAGFGCRAGATAASLRAALTLASADHAAAMLAIAADRLAIAAPLADDLALPLVGIAADTLAAIATPTRSPASLAARGTGSVAEAAALAAAGPGARLLVSRRISPDRMATCALAIPQETPA